MTPVESVMLSSRAVPRRRATVLLAAVAGLVAATVAVPALPAEASGSGARIWVTTTRNGVVAEGSGFRAGATGALTVASAGSQQIERLRISSSGGFSLKTMLPASHLDATLTAEAGGTTATTSVAPPAGTTTTAPPSSAAPSATTDPSTTGADPRWASVVDPTTTPWGPLETYTPVHDVSVPVGSLTQSLLDGHPEGTRFGIRPGHHRLTTALRPRRGQQLLGFPGAVISGSKPLTSWQREGSLWFVAGQTQRLPGASVDGFAVCAPDRPMCNHPEDVFVDHTPLTQVASKSQLRTGTYFFDYANSRIYLADDPTGRTVETTVAPAALLGMNGTTVRNLTIEKFGNAAQMPAVQGTNLTVEANLIRLNHGQGIAQYGGVMRLNRILWNGQLGVGGGGTGLLVESNEIAHNNHAGHYSGWEAGGTKWAHARDLTVRSNWSHHNDGSGFTTDLNNHRVLYEHNRVEANAEIGIMHEVSYAATIRTNVIRDNGTRRERWFTSRVGINVTNSRDVVVHDNLVWGNSGGGVLLAQDTRNPASSMRRAELGTWELANTTVRDNVVQLLGDGSGWRNLHGMDVHTGVDRKYFTQMNNRFHSNTYHVPAGAAATGRWFLWEGEGRSWTQWTAAGPGPGEARVSY
jgi:hypothetical protein